MAENRYSLRYNTLKTFKAESVNKRIPVSPPYLS